MSKIVLVIASIALSLLIIAVGFYVIPFKGDKIDIRKFSGNIIGIDGETITLKGVFLESLGTIPENLSSQRDFSFRVNSTTRFEKLETILPTYEEIVTAGGRMTYNLEDRPQIKGEGSLDDLKNSFSLTENGASAVNISVEVDFSSSIYKSKNPVASFVFYHILVRPRPPSTKQTL